MRRAALAALLALVMTPLAQAQTIRIAWPTGPPDRTAYIRLGGKPYFCGRWQLSATVFVTACTRVTLGKGAA